MKKSVLFTAINAVIFSSYSLAQPLLEETVVTASKNETPIRQIGASVTVIDEQEIELRGYNAIADLLRTEAGVSVSNSGGAGKVTSLRIRGEEGYRTLVLIDGIEMSDPTGPQVSTAMEHINANGEIEKVEILRGPQGFVYGADAGGVVNIFTRTVDEGIQGQIGVQGGSYQQQDVNGYIASGSARGDVFLSAAKNSTDGYNSLVSDSEADKDGYENQTLHFKGGLNLSENWRAQFVLRDVEGNTEYDNCGYPTTHDCKSDYSQQAGRLSASYSGEKMNHQLALAKTNTERDYLADGVFSYGYKGDVEKVEYLGSAKILANSTLVFGLDNKSETVVIEGGDDLSQDQSAVFAEWQGQFSDNAFYTFGGRYDDSDDFGEHFSYRATTAWVQSEKNSDGVDQGLKYRASFGTGFRAPSLYEIAYNAGPDAFGAAAETVLTEEQSRGFDIGVDYFIDGKALVQLTYFNQKIEDEIYYDMASYSGYLQRSGTTSSKGVELAADYAFSSTIKFVGNVTHNESETSDNLPRLRRPQLQGNMGLQFAFMDNNLNMLANLRLATDADDEVYDNDTYQNVRVPLDDYQVLDVSANYSLKDWTFSLRVENLTDKNYEEVTNYNTGGRKAYLGAKFTF
ncbi:TonB-dependent receptor plug domain-containing protein [Teredinibacter haidensis]|uniref:TonB-dependent receptor plug domain-containing protein n=1 Tax=Teredinibacter haidensis TaxID=2731755 RepID=UPI000948B26D|nr:TonB-dependent receptor [Teredinibacter haidensis]